MKNIKTKKKIKNRIRVVELHDDDNNLWHLMIYEDRVLAVFSSNEPCVYKFS